jgi:hypothetical protein
MTKASVNFKKLTDTLHAVSHTARTVSPSYLLSIDKSLGTICILDDEGKVSRVHKEKLAMASSQALRSNNYSPLWEGILNLPRPDLEDQYFDEKAYKAHCETITKSWIDEYEKSTGHKVLRADIHLDEGHIDEDKVLLNAHAHIVADRTNELGKVLKIAPKQLRDLQTMTAKTTQLERGKSSLETNLKHISHHAYRHLAEQGRLQTNAVAAELTTEKTKIVTTKDAEIAQYKRQRDALKASGEATQADYQILKKAHEKALEALKIEKLKVKDMAEKITHLEKQMQADKALFAEMTDAYQKEKEKGAAPHSIAPVYSDALEQNIKDFRDGWVSFIDVNGFQYADLNKETGYYFGEIIDNDDFFAVQNIGYNTCVIHDLRDFGQQIATGAMVEVEYKDGAVAKLDVEEPDAPEYDRPK